MSKHAAMIEPSETKLKLMDAGARLMRAHGYNATTVDHICAEAGVTKGGFFHYFKSKDDVAKAAVTHFFDERRQRYEEAAFRKLPDPLDRVFGRLDFAKVAMGGTQQVTKGCLIGVFAQELSFSNAEIRAICQAFFSRMVDDFSRDLAEAQARHKPPTPFDSQTTASFYLAIVQGSMLLAKTASNNSVLCDNIEQFRNYLRSLFGLPIDAYPAAADPSRN